MEHTTKMERKMKETTLRIIGFILSTILGIGILWFIWIWAADMSESRFRQIMMVVVAIAFYNALGLASILEKIKNQSWQASLKLENIERQTTAIDRREA